MSGPSPWTSDPSPVDDGQRLPPAGSRAARPPRRPRATLLLLTLLALVGLGVGVQQRQVAAGWRDRAERLEQERDDARGRAEAFQRQLDEIAASLALSESDVAALEDRVRDLADEKAQAEDVATTTTVERDTLAELSVTVANAIGGLDRCVDQLFDLLNDAIAAFNRQAEGEVVDVAPLNAERTATTAWCNDARRAAAEASTSADRLSR